MPTSAELTTLLQRVADPQPAGFFESETLEFKQPRKELKRTLDLLSDAAVCFTNASGGTIVLGVNDKATTKSQAFVGVDAGYSIDVVRRGIFDRTSPKLTTIAYELEVEGVRLVVIDVPAGLEPHSNTAGTSTRRLGKECRPFTPEQQREVLMARGQVDWSAESSGLLATDVAESEVDRLRRLLQSAGSTELAELRTERLLAALGLVDAKGRLRNAGVLLLVVEERLSETIPAYGFSYQFRPTSGSEATTRFRQTRPMFAGIEALLDAVGRRIEVRPLNLAGGVQVSLVDYPPDAIRELVVNAFIHRSYDHPGTVDIEHTPERLSISNPGGLVAGITPSNILTAPSTPRHRLLADVISRTKIAERTGQGIDRAYREMLRVGKEPPLFEDSEMRTRVVLSGGIGNDAFVRFVSELPSDVGSDVEVLLTLSYLRARSTVDAKRLAQLLQRTPHEAQDVLERLAGEEAGILEVTRGTARRHFASYRLKSESLTALARAVGYRRRTIDQTDAKVIAHISEYGSISNRTLQRMFDLDVYRARNLLTDLQARGIVAKIGNARGGPGVRYGPGPQFGRAKPPNLGIQEILDFDSDEDT